MVRATIIALLSVGFAIAAPIHPRDVTLDPVATAQAQVRDDTATRAFSAAEIQASNGQCLSIDPDSGDFRENLIPVSILPCNGSAGQQWDVITAGVHNNVPGTALFVSSLTQGCLNFDPRRAAGNQVLLFSCGGRADGGGTVTNSQLFTFASNSTSIPLLPTNQADTCLFSNNGLLDDTSCDTSSPAADEIFTIVGGTTDSSSGSAASASAITDVAVAISSSVAVTSAASTSSVAVTSASTTSSAPLITATTVLDPAAVAQAQVRDDTATRAFSAAQIQSNGQCLTVNANSGDFRENLIPITIQDCDGSTGQQWDVITAGVHNNVPGTALFVSSLTQGCLNFDPRRAAGNQVLLFSCGGRADGGGTVTNSQLFTFANNSTTIPLVTTSQANTCLFNNNGFLDDTSCDTSNPTADEIFNIVGGTADSSSGSAAPTSAITDVASSAVATSSSVAATSAATTSSVAATSAATTSSVAATSAATTSSVAVTSASTTASAPLITATTVLDPAAVAQAQVRDDTATRAFSAAQIQSNGQCLTVNANSGDFRENLIPITIQDCDGSAGQQWDVITAGVHNNVPGTALFVSTLTQGCLNFDPRRAAGNQVLLFSCGGRADGGGSVTNSQLFTFANNSTTVPLVTTSQANTCLFSNNGFLDDTSCDTSNPTADELFTIVP
ncbi:hypothetical protein BT96DRAFT_962164 [Gymnopus androsaceus JB14]|uniref:Ricin B lectin domain-containing protein n=1 Tax=Gymnopus androsaceus JB14 TaxID=1447944 RepID=A0A6A4IFT4_9AGAR|nr:hypothetical protein BT96DRAFT_962164 [Gymnopus androsaceus JB14]